MTTNQSKGFEKQVPAEIDGMVTVSYAAFFATVGQLDVHPEIVSSWDRIFGYRSDWKLRSSREMVGVTVGGTCFSHSRYMVTRQFFNSHRAAIAAAD